MECKVLYSLPSCRELPLLLQAEAAAPVMSHHARNPDAAERCSKKLEVFKNSLSVE